MIVKKFIVELNEEQLRTIADCVEDVHRFACGQTELHNTVSNLPSERWKDLRYHLRLAEQLVNPDLFPGQSYDWAGNGCKHRAQRDFIASTYYLYREIRHQLALANQNPQRPRWNIYVSPTLTCEESGPAIRITRLPEKGVE
jgi:hypothetical protein